MPIHVTLVHGTGARGALWTKGDSSLCKYLAERFPGSIEIHPFDWSGSNRLKDRIEAAHELRTELENAVDRLGATHTFYTIAHSHGGNVAAYAVAGSQILNGRVGVICLATPFLVLSERAALVAQRITLPGLRLALAISAILALVGPLVKLIGVFGFLLDWLTSGSEYVPILSLVVFSLGLCSFLGVCLAAFWMTRPTRLTNARRLADQYLSETDLSRLGSPNVLIVRSDSDEATIVLLASQFLVLASERSLSALVRLIPSPRFLIKIVKVLAAVFGCAALAWPFSHSVGFLLFILGALVVYYPLTILIAFLICIWAFLCASFLALALFAGAGGWDLIACQPFVRVSFEAMPLGSYFVHEFRAPEVQGALRHSSTYDDPRVHELIYSWMSHRSQETLKPEFNQTEGGSNVVNSPA